MQYYYKDKIKYKQKFVHVVFKQKSHFIIQKKLSNKSQ